MQKTVSKSNRKKGSHYRHVQKARRLKKIVRKKFKESRRRAK
jgi:hypothetical protein